MLTVGVDEAGYGPPLGPMCHGLAVFRGPSRIATACMWELLRPAVSRAPAVQGAIEIDDSKSIFSGPRKRERLRRTMAAAASCLSRPPFECEGQGVLERLLYPDDLQRLLREPWWCGADREPATSGFSEPVSGLQAALKACGLALVELQVRAMDPGRFNAELDRTGNKADVAWAQVSALVRTALAQAAEGEDVRCVVDRQGGRKYYAGRVGELLKTVLVQVEEETARRSAYRCETGGRRVWIEFVEKGEQASLPVALASMAAKYVREGFMDRFNAFFQRQEPGVQPTAGYPEDAKRFLRDTAALRRRLGIPDEALIRRK